MPVPVLSLLSPGSRLESKYGREAGWRVSLDE